MSINVDEVGAVLLADGWHFVQALVDNPACGSFDFDAYEFVEPHVEVRADAALIMHGMGRAGICPTAATWIDKESGVRLSCPLTSVLAVQESANFFLPPPEPKPKPGFVPKEVTREVKEIKDVNRPKRSA